MYNCFRRKIRIPMYIVVLFMILFVLLFYKHVKNVHQKWQMFSRFVSYDQFLHEVMSNVDELNRKINESSHTIRKLSETFYPGLHSTGGAKTV